MKGNFFYKRLGQRVFDERRRLKISQEELAFECNVDRTYVARIEEGKANPTIKVLYKVAKALRLRIFELVEGV